MSDIEMKAVLISFALTLAYFLASTASQLHAANERLAAVEMRMNKIEVKP